MPTARTSLVLAALFAASCASDYDLTAERPDVDPGDVTDCGFTPVPGTKISEYDCNPVFTTTDEAWGQQVDSIAFHTTEVLGHPFYQVWYSAAPSGTNYGNYGLGYGVSGDGTNWDIHPNNPLFSAQANAWDQDGMDAVQVVWDEFSSRYVMTYQGFTVGTDAFLDPSTFGMGVATSPDGVNWTKHPNNPVIDFSAAAGSGLDPYTSPCWPLTLTTQGGAYRAYLGAAYIDPWDFSGENPPCEVYPATAVDLGIWQTATSPVLRADQWYDAAGVISAAIVEHNGVQYMFYVSFEEWVQSGADIISSSKHHINLATSTDGFTWIKDPNNPIPISRNNPGYIGAVGAQVIGSRIHLWVTDYYPELGESAVGYYYFEPDLEAVHP